MASGLMGAGLQRVPISVQGVGTALLLVFAACGGRSDGSVAMLASADGQVEKQANTDADWTASEVGTRFALGSAVRTGAASSAFVELTRGGMVKLDADTVVRFARDHKRHDLSVEAGGVVIESSDEAIRFDTELGAATVEAGATVRVSARADGSVHLEVMVGRVVVEEEDGNQITVASGHSIDIEVGGVIIEDDGPAADGPADAGPTAAPAQPVSATITGDGATLATDDGWQPLEQGEQSLAPSSHIRSKKGTTIELVRGGQRARLSGAIDAVVGGADGALVTASAGTVTAIADGENVRVAVPGGTILVRTRPGGSEANVAVADDGTTVTVRRGRAEVAGETLQPGETGTLSRDGAVDVSGRAPETAVISMVAGETATVLAPQIPVAIGVRFADGCDGEGVVEIAGRKGFGKPAQSSAGTGRANLLLAAGKHRYRLRCGGADEPAASGVLRVRKDTGKRQLARGAPHNKLEADGRRYRVLYQNHLPRFTMSWSAAPKGKLTLKVQHGKRTPRQYQLKKPTYSIASGALGEGSYQFWFEAAGRRSPRTQLTIEFDNAAATAYIERVRKLDDGAVRVEGAVLAGWSVGVNGKRSPLDSQRRFALSATPHPGDTGVGVRLDHPRHGTRYYAVEAPP